MPPACVNPQEASVLRFSVNSDISFRGACLGEEEEVFDLEGCAAVNPLEVGAKWRCLSTSSLLKGSLAIAINQPSSPLTQNGLKQT